MKPENYPCEPAHLWDHFYRITQIPRPSKSEAEVRQYVINCAKDYGCEWVTDFEGNLIVRVPGTKNREHKDPLIIQNHLDMVTVKQSDKQHDFENDPLNLKVTDGWLHADRTTLGADNGLGCAASLALMTDQRLSHPPLELLFTVDEETGLGGAMNLNSELLTGTRLLNLDTEDWNELFIGCTGGAGWKLSNNFNLSQDEFANTWHLSISGLSGGHSGIQIHEQLGNAIKLACQYLLSIGDVRLACFDGGTAHNVIPREVDVVFSTSIAIHEELNNRLIELSDGWRDYLPSADKGLACNITPVNHIPVIDEKDSSRILNLVSAFPHGAISYSTSPQKNLVDLSANLASIRLSKGEFILEASCRFFRESQALPLQQAVTSLSKAFDMKCHLDAGYPGWDPDLSSDLLTHGVDLHTRLFDFEPEIKAIHAGLECGILKGKMPHVDMLSFGPTIKGAHSPQERLEIATVEPFWRYLISFIEEL